ncbi:MULTISPECIES: hypothetical protein [unclassified Acinetobacter]|uniref:hypothetical protein n=1 Tax=unclassified Acinetobacter TaxID=196816 RepID=UPI00190D181A|nr:MULTISPECIES: hypothetical protein [unclassified Acinetobacter]MBK0063566.1 hypothetical protein [Acinetobacter sp. S55]MBK0065363.1 hypothetical protein [Acinetobacter sp. S54]
MSCFTGCASIISGSTQTMTIKSVPDSAQIKIINKSGEAVHQGETPLTVTLKRGAGYFKPQSYTVTFNKAGYQAKTVQIQATVNGWYFGNILLGGILGLLVIDPAKGAMYRLNPNDVNVVLDQEQSSEANSTQAFTVILKQALPESIAARAEKIAQL